MKYLIDVLAGIVIVILAFLILVTAPFWFPIVVLREIGATAIEGDIFKKESP